MKHRIAFINLSLVVVLLVLTSTAAPASNTWYVDGVHGKNKNDCKSPQTACKTIGHAISLAHSGDSIMVAAATYTENLGIGFNLKIVGSGANTTIIDGGGVNTVVTISNANAHVALSKVTIQNGVAREGGGIFNKGSLTIREANVSGNSAGSGGGSGILNSGMLAIKNSSISSNSAGCITRSCTVGGGGIENSGTVSMNNSTVSGNLVHCTVVPCDSSGGGIDTPALGNVTITNSTITGNRAYAPCVFVCPHHSKACCGTAAGVNAAMARFSKSPQAER